MSSPVAPSKARTASSTPSMAIYSDDSPDYGTLGCIARLGDKSYLLGSAHVLARKPLGLQGKPSIRRRADNALIGTLSEASSINIGPQYLNRTDVALAELTATDIDGSIGGWGPPTSSSTDLNVGTRVFLCGAKSGPMSAVVTTLNWEGAINYTGLGKASFTKLVRVEPAFGHRGDSGAAVLNDEMQVVGLHMASDGGKYSLFCSIAAIRDKWPGLRIGDD